MLVSILVAPGTMCCFCFINFYDAHTIHKLFTMCAASPEQSLLTKGNLLFWDIMKSKGLEKTRVSFCGAQLQEARLQRFDKLNVGARHQTSKYLNPGGRGRFSLSDTTRAQSHIWDAGKHIGGSDSKLPKRYWLAPQMCVHSAETTGAGCVLRLSEINK